MSSLNRMNTRILPTSFNYYEPRTIDEALKLLSELSPEVRILAGGTDLIVKMKARQVEPKNIINIKRIEGLRYITEEKGKIKIGALATWRDLEKSWQISKKIPALFDAISVMGSVQVRSMATIAGNLCNASPAADSAPPLLVHGAIVKASSIRGTREIPLDKFFLSPGKTILMPDEIVVEIEIPVPPQRSSSAFLKLSRTAMDLAKASAAAYLEVEDGKVVDAKIALGAVAPRPVRSLSAEAELIGKPATEETFSLASRQVVKDISPIDDIRSTASYRKKVSPILVEDALKLAFSRIRGELG
ncbi:MAG: FAD binding domain-containing protein [Fervidicoccaceae archaeon]